MKIQIGPIQFTKKELHEAREGNYKLIDKRLRRELPGRARLLKAVGKPNTKAQLRRLTQAASR